MASSVVTRRVVEFLKTAPPFQFLPEKQLQELTDEMALEYFPRNTVILSEGSKPSESLYIVQKGGVKLTLRTEASEEIVLDVRAEGEIFGLLSLLGGDSARLNVTTVEDTLCYSIPGQRVMQLMGAFPEFSAYLMRTSVTRYVDHALAEMRSRTQLMAGGEGLLYSVAVAEAAHKTAQVCPASTTVQAAAAQMGSAGASCLFVAGRDGQAVGIVTETDLARKVIAPGLAPTVPVTNIMSSPVVSVESSERVFQALLKMLAHDIHHVLVTEKGLPKNVLSYHDLMLLQGKSPLNVARNIEEQRSLDDLVAAQHNTTELIPLLMREGAKASHITRVVAEINDRILAKILQLAQEQLGAAPVPYCWVALGSEGRREQTFKTDQDNALIFADTAAEGKTAEEYFERLAAFVQEALSRCGYPLCQGGFMATNPRWRKSVSDWRLEYEHWIKEPVQRGVQNALIFFDMRPVAGSFSLFEELSRHNYDLLKTASFFKSLLAYVSILHKPPLGFFRTFVVERSGEHKDELDLKLFGAWPIVSAIRLFALDVGIQQTNTTDRLKGLEDLDYADPKLLKDLGEAFEFLTLLRLERQLEQRSAGQEITNYISPAALSNLQKSLLKETFQTIVRVQSLVESKFKTAVWAQLP